MKKIHLNLLLPAFLFFSHIMVAEVDTTANVRGTTNTGGVTIVATHMPTGTVKRTVSSDSGNYSLSFLPIGGPYKIIASKDGFASESINDVFLILGKPANIKFTLALDSEIEDVTVTAKAIEGLDMSSGTSLNREDIDLTPSVSNAMQDYVKFDPRVVVNGGGSRDAEIIVMGRNGRFNDFTIDGISYNDPFGLNDNGFATMRNPISMEFVDQISVEITPYDASRGGFTGGSIAVVTKSGSNEFSGSAYYSKRDQGDVGDFQNGESYPEFEESFSSFTFSGPIIKDKLFFFLGYEENELTEQTFWGTSDSNAPNKATHLTNAEADRIATIARGYGIEPGLINSYSYPETQESVTLKLTGIINDKNRAVMTYSHSEDYYVSLYGGRSNRLYFSDYGYKKDPEIDRLSFTLYSDITDRLSTKIRYSTFDMTEDDTAISTLKSGIAVPDIRVNHNGGRVYLGGDRYRGINYIETEREVFSFKGTYDLGKHVITAGYETKVDDTRNDFGSRWNGEMTFDSIDDFEAGTWSYLRTKLCPGGVNDISCVSNTMQVDHTSFYIQDTIYVSDILTVVLGLRNDSVSSPDKPRFNQSYFDTWGVRNDTTFDNSVNQPRFSFELDSSDIWFQDTNIISSTLRGGYGLFMGRIPLVFYHNAYGNSGAAGWAYERNFDNELASGVPCPMTNPANHFWLNSSCGYVPDFGGNSAYGVKTIDEKFESPSSYRGNIALDLVTQGGYAITLEINKDIVNKSVRYSDIGYSSTETFASGRQVSSSDAENIHLSNQGEGEATAYTFMVDKDFGNVSTHIGYTNMEATDMFSLTSAQAESSYRNQVWTANNEDVSPARSDSMVEHKLVAALDYTTQIFGSNDTRFSLVFIRKSGEPYSMVYDWNAWDSLTGNGVHYGSNDSVYVPTDVSDSNVAFSSDAVASAVMDEVNSSCMAGYKGSIMPRNACTSPYQSRLDLRVTQDIAAGPGTVVIYFDILNVLNLLDDEKGVVRDFGGWGHNTSDVFSVDSIDSSGANPVPIIEGVRPNAGLDVNYNNGRSNWQMNLGFKYKF